MIRCIIIEDESLAVERLHRLLLRADDCIEVVAVLDSVAEARQWFANPLPADLIFADIQLGDGLCFEIFETCPPQIPIVFTTSYDEYAVESFTGQRFDYLLKPIKLSELKKTLATFRANRSRFSDKNYIRRIKALLAQLTFWRRNPPKFI